MTNGEAPVEIKQAAAQGNIVTSMGGFSVLFNNIDGRKNPTTGYAVNFKQDVAGLGGQSEFVRETFDARWYHPITEDFIGLVHLQAGQINSFGSRDALIINNFMEGSSLVRGFAPGGMGPRDISDRSIFRPARLAVRAIMARRPRLTFRSSVCRKKLV